MSNTQYFVVRLEESEKIKRLIRWERDRLLVVQRQRKAEPRGENDGQWPDKVANAERTS